MAEHREDKQRFHAVQRGVLYRSSQPELKDLAGLKRRHITQVINLRGESEDQAMFADERSALAAAGVKMVHMPLSGAVPDDAQVEQFLRAINDCKGATLVHCAQGRGRTGIMVAAYRVIAEAWPAQKAFDEMIRFGEKPSGNEEAAKLALLDRLTSNRQQWLDKLSHGGQ
jgi:uncharacterized protein (TIGR01244 family)